MEKELPFRRASAPVPKTPRVAVATLLTVSPAMRLLFENLVCMKNCLVQMPKPKLSGRNYSGNALLFMKLAQGSFPGRIRPGLIEASVRIAGTESMAPTFRGGSAPASLKRADHLGRRRRDLPRFPGRIRPGLIEAWRQRARSRGRRPSFRGGSAPASLKRVVLDPHARLLRRPFRGGSAPASLKHGCANRPQPPGRFLSGADPPRPH